MKISNHIADTNYQAAQKAPMTVPKQTTAEPVPAPVPAPKSAGFWSAEFWQSHTVRNVIMGLAFAAVFVAGVIGLNGGFKRPAQLARSALKTRAKTTVTNSKAEAKRQVAIKKFEAQNAAAKSDKTDASADNTDAKQPTSKGHVAHVKMSATAVQKRLQAAFPNLTIGNTTVKTKGHVGISSAGDTDKITSTLSAHGHDFATVTTQDGTDTLRLLQGYQKYVQVKTNQN